MLILNLRKNLDGGVSAIKDDKIIATWPEHITKPDYRNKYVMFNCARYEINWLAAEVKA